jgi:iron complex transport system ATP-binding protein
MSNARPLLRYRDVTVGYGAEQVVQHVDFSLAPGEILGIIGPNGSGKSTLIKALFAQSDILSGTIELDGEPINDLLPAQRARKIGVLPQSITAPFQLTARQFVRLGSIDAMLGIPDSQLDQAVDRSLALADSQYLASKPITRLSGGELQRTYFAQALVNDPSLLVLDEPTSHLDINHRLQLFDTVQTLARTHEKAALIIYHDFDMAVRYSDAVIVISPRAVASADHPHTGCAAQLAPAAPPLEILTPALFEEVFGVQAKIEKDKIVFLNRVTRK